MAEEFDYGALWSIARDTLDAVNILTSAIRRFPSAPTHPSAFHRARPGEYEKWEAELKTLPKRRAMAVDATRNAGEKLAKLLAENRFIAPIAGVWPPSAPEIARRLSLGLGMAASAARALSAWKGDAYIDQPKRYAVDSASTLQTVVTELERRPEVAELAYQRQIEKLRAKHPDWSADEALASWQNGHGGDDGDLIERLLGGPDGIELTPKQLARLAAELNQAVSLSTIQQEKRAAGESETPAKRDKLRRILDFNQGLQATVDRASAAEPAANSDNGTAHESGGATPGTKKPKRSSERGEGLDKNHAAVRLLSVFTNGLADERLDKASNVLSDDGLTVDEKLWKIDALMPFPPTVSAAKLGKSLGVSKTAIQNTTWYIQKRKGQKDNEIGRRHEQHRQRGQQYEPDRIRDDGD